jgi:peptide-methionine (S)-S-oxide reductase
MAATQTATFAGGCFWCIEAAFQQLDGVEAVTSGYCGGHVEDPTYREVCSETTGHAEAVQVRYDPGVVSYADLLEVFFAVHDPTTLNRQGPDVGSQYRSAIFYHDDDQRERATRYVEALREEYDDDVVTEIEPLETFYVAEDYHQDYYEKQRTEDGTVVDGYCRVNVQPKVERVRERFADMVRS